MYYLYANIQAALKCVLVQVAEVYSQILNKLSRCIDTIEVRGCIALCNVFTPTRKALDFEHAPQ